MQTRATRLELWRLLALVVAKASALSSTVHGLNGSPVKVMKYIAVHCIIQVPVCDVQSTSQSHESITTRVDQCSQLRAGESADAVERPTSGDTIK